MEGLARFLLLFPLAALEQAADLQVQQNPPLIQASPGDSVELFCHVNATPWERLRVAWRRYSDRPFCQVLLHNVSVSNCCRGSEACDTRFSFSWHLPTFTLRMGNLREDDVGWYRCEVTVEIPMYKEAQGNGTMLNVSAAGGGGGEEGGGGLRNLIRDPVLWLGLAGALAVAVLLPAVICCYKHRCKNAGQEIYVNVLYHQKQAEKKAEAQADGAMKHSSIYTLEFQRSRKPPVARRSPGPAKAPQLASSFESRATQRP